MSIGMTSASNAFKQKGTSRKDGNVVEKGLVGYWPLRRDCRDYSGRANHGINHGLNLEKEQFDGREGYIEVPQSPSINLGLRDFSVSAWVYTEQNLEDVIGDVLCKYDASRRKGFNLSIKSSSGGYNSHGNDKHVYFGIDNGRASDWEDCGRPSATSNYVSNSLTVFDGHLYAGTTDGDKEEDWCHVYRYAGGTNWDDCGRVGKLRTRGVGPMVVHDGKLYAATWSYDWTRVETDRLDSCRVYQYQGGQDWKDCGQPGQCRRLFGMASFRGGLYVVGDDHKCYVNGDGNTWRVCGEFPNYAHPMAVHDRKLYVGVLNPAGVYSYDGTNWTPLGNPLGSEEHCDQIHALEVYRGKLYATTWPEGRVAAYENTGQWVDCGRLGDSTEINGLTVYNGKLYAGSIPRAEVYRYVGGKVWTLLKRFFAPEGWEPIPVKHDRSLPDSRKRIGEWTRVTSLTVYKEKLFASIGSCTSSILDAPADVRGRVFAMEAGKCISYDYDLGPGWKHLVALKNNNRLELYVNGKLQAGSSVFDPKDFDISNSAPLKIGYGEMDYFSGRIKEVRLYNRALSEKEVAGLSTQ